MNPTIIINKTSILLIIKHRLFENIEMIRKNFTEFLDNSNRLRIK